MSQFSEEHVYDALALPNDALANGGVEILRAGIIDDELFVTARHAFTDPAQWGEVLAEIVRRLAKLYAAEGELDAEEALAAIAAAFAADLGAPMIEKPKPARKPAAKKAKPATTARSKPARGKRAAKPTRAAPKKSSAKRKR
jgi:hypothetical protein